MEILRLYGEVYGRKSFEVHVFVAWRNVLRDWTWGSCYVEEGGK